MKLIKSFAIACLVSLSFISFVRCETETKDVEQTDPEQSKALDIYLLIGQSNMAGRAPVEELDKVILENVYLFNNKEEWEVAKNLTNNGINRYSTVKKNTAQVLSPGYTFGRKLSKYTNSKIAIVSNARGGTKIQWWQKGYKGDNDFDLYEEAVKRAEKALSISPEGSKIKGIIWHQGEADNSVSGSKLYMDLLKKLVSDLRKDLNDSELPIIVGEVGKWNDRGLNINPILRSVKSQITNSDCVSSDGLTSINLAKNDPHFDNLSQRVLGERYADKAASLIYNIKTEGVTLFTDTNYEGKSVLLNIGEYSGEDLESMGILLKEIASAKIDQDFELIINTNSEDKVIKQNTADIEEYKLQSIRIAKKN